MDQTVYHILRTAPGQEATVSGAISNAEVYMPVRARNHFSRRYRVWSKWDEPLFPGYLFINIDEPLSLRAFGASSHIRGFLRNADRSYAIISDSLLELVRNYENDIKNGFEYVKHPFRPNGTVEFISGAFSGFKAVVENLEGLEGLSVNIVGSTLSVHVTASQLREAPVA